MTQIEPLVAAAKALASGKSESVLANAGIVLADMKRAVETIVGKEVEVLTRPSKSTGRERLSFLLGKTVAGAGRKVFDAERLGQEVALLEKTEDVVNHLRTRGVEAEHVLKGSADPGYLQHLVDVVLNEKVLQYVPGQSTARLGNVSGINRSL